MIKLLITATIQWIIHLLTNRKSKIYLIQFDILALALASASTSYTYLGIHFLSPFTIFNRKCEKKIITSVMVLYSIKCYVVLNHWINLMIQCVTHIVLIKLMLKICSVWCRTNISFSHLDNDDDLFLVEILWCHTFEQSRSIILYKNKNIRQHTNIK